VNVDGEYRYCDACGETVYTLEEATELQRQVATQIREQLGLLMPEAITEIREDLGLSKAAFERLLGVGPKTVTRWERGTVFQNRATDTLLRLIANVPGTAEFLAALHGVKLPQKAHNQMSFQRTFGPSMYFDGAAAYAGVAMATGPSRTIHDTGPPERGRPPSSAVWS
jgi:putative zinc finger/helix-turn-helix YgiT family protein